MPPDRELASAPIDTSAQLAVCHLPRRLTQVETVEDGDQIGTVRVLAAAFVST
jgi:hypothetical protein